MKNSSLVDGCNEMDAFLAAPFLDPIYFFETFGRRKG